MFHVDLRFLCHYSSIFLEEEIKKEKEKSEQGSSEALAYDGYSSEWQEV